jgi:hypothetical protein
MIIVSHFVFVSHFNVTFALLCLKFKIIVSLSLCLFLFLRRQDESWAKRSKEKVENVYLFCCSNMQWVFLDYFLSCQSHSRRKNNALRAQSVH